MAERDPRRRSAAREQEAAPLFSEGERMFYDQDHDTEYQKKGRRKGRKKHSGSAMCLLHHSQIPWKSAHGTASPPVCSSSVQTTQSRA